VYGNSEMLRGDEIVPRIAWRLIYGLPKSSFRQSLIHAYRRKRFHDHLAHRLGGNFRLVEPGPIPPLELILETNVCDEEEVLRKGQAEEYVSSSYMGVLNFLSVLERCGMNLRTIGSVLDFGCGTGINIRMFRCLDGARLVGTDVNPKMIEWCSENVDGVEFYLNGLEPPLPFADDESFDLITSASVFTHIPLEIQQAWLEEMRRVLRPNGYFICTIAGAYHIGRQLTDAERNELYSTGELTMDADHPGVSLATRNAGSWDVFQTRDRVLESFRRVFDVIDYVATGGQDYLVLRRPSRGAGGGEDGIDRLVRTAQST
jgi:SAM-dependent methyltransferase